MAENEKEAGQSEIRDLRNIIVEWPSYQIKSEIVRNQLQDTFCLTVANPKESMVYCVCPSRAIRSEVLREGFRYINYGASVVDVETVHSETMDFVDEFKGLFSERDLNHKVLRKFIASYKQFYLDNRSSSKGLAVDTIILFSDILSGTSYFVYINPEGEYFTRPLFTKKPSVEIFACHANPKLEELSLFLSKIDVSVPTKAHRQIMRKLKRQNAAVYPFGCLAKNNDAELPKLT